MTDRLLPLAGLRVVEVSSFVAAPLGGMVAAQLGAEVIRVDPLCGASDIHRWPLAPSGASMYWAGLNKSKRSVTLDLHSERGRELCTDLIVSGGPDAGILLTNLGGRDWISYERLRELRPDLIHVQIMGHSDGAAAVDYTINAATGFPLVTGGPDTAEPVNHVLPAWDMACGLYAVVGIVSAERTRRLTGAGMQLSVSLQDVALSMAGALGYLTESQINSVKRVRLGNYIYGTFGRDFVCADGQRVMVAVLTRRHWSDLVRVCGLQEVISSLESTMGANFSDESDRFVYRELLAALLAPWFAEQSLEQVSVALAGTTVLWSRYSTFAEAVRENRSNPIMSFIEQPGIGRFLTPGIPLKLDGEAVSTSPAPVLGQDTAEILQRDLGLGPDGLAALSEAGTIRKENAMAGSTEFSG